MIFQPAIIALLLGDDAAFRGHDAVGFLEFIDAGFRETHLLAKLAEARVDQAVGAAGLFRLGRELISQLLRSTTSIAANIEEGYGRGYGRDYGRFLRIAEGSAREARGWYYRNREALPAEVVQHRMELATGLIKTLTITANQQRLRKVNPVRRPSTSD